MRSTLLNDPLITRETGRMKRGAALPSPQSCLVGQVAHPSTKEQDQRQNHLGRGGLRLSVRIVWYWECQCKRPILSAHNACAYARYRSPLQGGTPSVAERREARHDAPKRYGMDSFSESAKSQDYLRRYLARSQA